nr:hypothetical protein [Tanacetum cinerariifolium]
MWGLKEFSSCGALYTKSCGCSKGGFIDKYVRDPNKTPDSSQRPPHDCPRCGSLVDGLYCRHCAILRKKLKKVWFIICDEHKFFQDCLNTSKSSNDDSNVVSMPQEPVVFNQNPGENSSQSPPQIDHHCCYGCGNSLDGIFCQRCTSSWDVSSLVTTTKKSSVCYDDEDDEESSIPLRAIIISELPPYIAITPVISTKESLSMGDEHLDTIPEKESDEFINHEEVIHQMSFKTYSNPLFDLDEEIISSEFNLIHNEDLDSTLKNDCFDTKSYLLESLLNRDTLMASTPKFDSLLEEFSGELAYTDLIPLGINEANYDPEEDIHLVERLLYDNSSPRPPEEFDSKNSDAIIESFSPSPIPVEDNDQFMEEIDLFLASDESIPPGIENDYSNSEGDNLFLERLFHDDPIPFRTLLTSQISTEFFFPFSPIWYQGLKTKQKQKFLGSIQASLQIIRDQDEVDNIPRACHWKEHEISSPMVPLFFYWSV